MSGSPSAILFFENNNMLLPREVLGGVLSSLEKEAFFTHLFIHKIYINYLSYARGSVSGVGRMENKTDMVTTSRSSQFSGKSKSRSVIQIFGTLWTVQSMEFSRPEYWSG